MGVLPYVKPQFSRHATFSAVAAVVLGPIVAVMGCASQSDASPAPQAALPDDTDDTTFVKASPESAAKYGVAYWGSTPDGDRIATTVVGYGANQEKIITLRYDIDHVFALDLSGPGIDARVRVDMTTEPSVSGVTDAAVQMYDQIAADAQRAADENDDESSLAGVGAGTGLVGAQALVTYSKPLLNKCWTKILPCRAQTRLLVKNYNALVLGCGGANKSLVCKSVTDRTCWWTNSKGQLCSNDLPAKKDAITAQRAECETERTDCLKQGLPTAGGPQCTGTCA
jgi:hypothetical protein